MYQVAVCCMYIQNIKARFITSFCSKTKLFNQRLYVHHDTVMSRIYFSCASGALPTTLQKKKSGKKYSTRGPFTNRSPHWDREVTVIFWWFDNGRTGANAAILLVKSSCFPNPRGSWPIVSQHPLLSWQVEPPKNWNMPPTCKVQRSSIASMKVKVFFFERIFLLTS